MTDISPATPTDERLAKKAQHNDLEAFEKLIEKYEQPLLRYILRISSFSVEEAEEILQEIFLKAWKNLKDFDASLKFSSWIYRIAHNETISEFRKAESRGRNECIAWDEELMGALPDTIDLETELNQKMTSEQVQKVIAMLPEKYRDVLVLKFLEEKSYEEISDILKIPGGTVATLINRAKKAFKEAFERNELSSL